MKITGVSIALAASLTLVRTAAADVPITKIDGWELYTNGRINAFFSYGQGDANPLPLNPGENITPGGGLSSSRIRATSSSASRAWIISGRPVSREVATCVRKTRSWMSRGLRS